MSDRELTPLEQKILDFMDRNLGCSTYDITEEFGDSAAVYYAISYLNSYTKGVISFTGYVSL